MELLGDVVCPTETPEGLWLLVLKQESINEPEVQFPHLLNQLDTIFQNILLKWKI